MISVDFFKIIPERFFEDIETFAHVSFSSYHLDAPNKKFRPMTLLFHMMMSSLGMAVLILQSNPN